MSAIVWSDVVAFAPALATTPVAVQDLLLAYVNGEAVSPAQFGGEGSATYRLARLYLAAHLGTTGAMAMSGASGPVTSESAGGLSVSYGTGGAYSSDSELTTTVFGRQFLALVRRSPAVLPVVV